MAGQYDDLTLLSPAALSQIKGFKSVVDIGAAHLFEDAAYELRLQPNQYLHQQDTPLTHVWLLVEGRIAEVRRDKEESGRARQYLMREVSAVLPSADETEPQNNTGRGAWLSIYDYLFEFQTYRTQARAVDACRLVAIAVSDLGRMIFQAPQLRQALADFPTISRLRTMPTLRSVELVGLGFLAEAAGRRAASKDELLYATDDNLDSLFFVDQGQVLLDDDGDILARWVGNGGVVGVASGVNAQGPIGQRTMDHRARITMTTSLLEISHRAFVQVTGFVPDPLAMRERQEREQTVTGLAMLESFTESQKRHLVGYFSHGVYPVNHLLIQQNEEADSLWVLMRGSMATVRALDNEGKKLVPTVAQGPTYFGETALLGQFPQNSTVEALAGSEWLRLHWHDFEEFDIIEPEDLRNKLVITRPEKGALFGKEARKRYKWLDPGEAVIFFSRRHWVAFLRKNFPTLIIFLMLLAFALLTYVIPGIDPLLLWVVIILAVMDLLAFIWGFIDYRNDWLVVTNRRVYYQEQLLFVNKWVKEAPLEQIQNVTFERSFWGKIFDFGTLVIQTAGSFGDIRFNYTTNFAELQAIIQRQRAQRRGHAAAQSKLKINRRLEDRLGLLVEPPSKVFVDELQSNAITGWQARLAQRASAGLLREEGKHMVWRQHWMALVTRIGWIWWLPFILLVVLFLPWSNTLDIVNEIWIMVANVLEVMAVLVLIAFVLRFGWVYIDWRNDTYELTDVDVSNLRQLPFGLRQDRKAASLGRIQNVEMRIPSPIHLLLDYGTVVIQTAAEDGALIFSSVPNPRFVASEISRRINQFQKNAEEEQLLRRSEDMPDWFEMYSRLEGSEQVQRQQAVPPTTAQRFTSRS